MKEIQFIENKLKNCTDGRFFFHDHFFMTLVNFLKFS